MKVENFGRRLILSDEDGFSHEFHAFWLREISSNESFRDPKTGHKIQDADMIDVQVRVSDLNVIGDNVEILFSDGHRSRYALSRLRRAAEQPFTDDLVGQKMPWDGSLSPLPWHSLKALKSDPEMLLMLLSDLAVRGFAMVRDVPAAAQGSRQFLDLIGQTRITNNGDIEDVKAVGDTGYFDLSMTSRALEPHVDNPYRVPQPGYTILHCLRNDAEGGESALIDGLFIAEKVRAARPDLFRALCTVPIVFRYIDDQAILENTIPFIDLRSDGRIGRIRFHGRCDQVIATDPATLEWFYEARRMYANLIKSEQSQLRFKLNPGELYIADNYRLFHARRAFTLSTGVRHMQQAYLDRDVVSSRQKTLMRHISAKPWKSRAKRADT